MTSPTQRTLAYCRQRGWRAQVVEKWLAPARRRIDLFGFGDVIALDGLTGSVLIQTTSATNAAARITKLVTECADAAEDWIGAGNRIHVHGWRKGGARGKRKVWLLNWWQVVRDGQGLVARRMDE